MKRTKPSKEVATVNEIDMNKLSAHDMLEMFRRGEHLIHGSDAYYLALTTWAALAAPRVKLEREKNNVSGG